MRPTKANYPEMEQEFVTSELSIREIARRHDLSWSTVAERAKREKWSDKRAAFRESINRRSYEKVIDRFSSDEAEIRAESVVVMRATLRRFAEQLRDKEINVSPRDAVAAVHALQLLLGEPTSRAESKVIEFSTGGLDPGNLRELLRLAKARVVEGSLAGDREPSTTRIGD